MLHIIWRFKADVKCSILFDGLKLMSPEVALNTLLPLSRQSGVGQLRPTVLENGRFREKEMVTFWRTNFIEKFFQKWGWPAEADKSLK